MARTQEELRAAIVANKQQYVTMREYINNMKNDYIYSLINSDVGIEKLKIMQGKIQVLNDLDALLG